MEKRALLAIVLSVAILLLWQWLVVPSAPPTPPGQKREAVSPPPAERGAAGVGAVTPAPGGPGGATLRPVAPAAGPVTAAGGPGAEVLTPLYRAVFNPDGTVAEWILRYRGDKPLVVGGPLPPLTVAVSRPGEATEVVALRPEQPHVEVGGQQTTSSLTFSGVTTAGLRIERRLTFAASSYRIDAELRVEAPARGTSPATVVLYWTSPVAVAGPGRDDPWVTIGETPEHQHVLGRILVGSSGRPEHLEAPPPALKDPKESPGGRELKDPHLVETSILPPGHRWIALESDHFIAALIPADGGRVLRGRERDLAQVALVFPDVQSEPGKPWEARAALYVGPKEWERLSALGVGLEQAQARNYGDFLWTLPMEWFCVPLLWLMNLFATRLPGHNYGVAIILLTVLVKIVFFPLSQKSMSSMKQMQALQPQINALRSKYKSDQPRFQKEQMELFRKHRVNPVGGCLPMVVQIPIFYALYLTIQYSVELHGAPFLFWIRDLSKMDPYYVLPILMGASMLIQQMMTPTVGDPRQARVMLIMPVVFTFMFLQFPTGLVLYWLINNLLSIGQQYLIERSVQRAKLAAAE